MIERGDKVKLFDRAKNVMYSWRKNSQQTGNDDSSNQDQTGNYND